MSKAFLFSLVILARIAQQALEWKRQLDEADGTRRSPAPTAPPPTSSANQPEKATASPSPSQPVSSPTRWVETPYGREPLFGDETPDDPRVVQRIAEANRTATQRCKDYYAAVERQKWGSIPPDMRGGLRVDRWGFVWQKNPHGRGWRELGTDDDYDVLPNSSW